MEAREHTALELEVSPKLAMGIVAGTVAVVRPNTASTVEAFVNTAVVV